MQPVVLGILLWWGAGALPAHANEKPALPAWTIRDAHQDRYLAVHGLRAFAGGYSEDGLEFWDLPAPARFRLPLAVRHGIGCTDGRGQLRRVDVEPASVTRHYEGADYRVREYIFTHAQWPGISDPLRNRGTRRCAVSRRIPALVEPDVAGRYRRPGDDVGCRHEGPALQRATADVRSTGVFRTGQ